MHTIAKNATGSSAKVERNRAILQKYDLIRAKAARGCFEVAEKSLYMFFSEERSIFDRYHRNDYNLN